MSATRGRPAPIGRDWSDPSYVRRLLGDAFELEFDESVCHWRAEPGESAWQLFSESDGPAKAGLAELASDAREALRRDWVEYFEQHREGTIVDVPRPYPLVIGRRRARRD